MRYDTVYLQMPGIRGTGTGIYQGWVRAHDFRWNNPGITIFREIDSSTPSLVRYCSEGVTIEHVTLDWVKDKKRVGRVEMTMVLLTSFFTDRYGSSEQVALNYADVKWSVVAQ